MRFEATEFVKRVLLEGFPADAPESGNPIDNGRLRFDSLRVEAVDDAIGGHRLVLALHGLDVATSRFGEFAPGMTLHLHGIEATMELRIARP